MNVSFGHWVQEPTAIIHPEAGVPELGEFLALEEPTAPAVSSDDDKAAEEEDENAGRLAWDKASDRIRSPLLRLHSGTQLLRTVAATTYHSLATADSLLSMLCMYVCSCHGPHMQVGLCHHQLQLCS